MIKKSIFLIGISAACFSCGNQSDNKEGKTDNNDAVIADTGLKVKQIPEMEENEEVTLPSPLRIAATLKRSGLKFIEGSLHAADNSKNYTSTYAKAVNLGVYSADMAYCILNKQYSLSKNYLKICKELGDGIGLGSAFESNNLAKRFENNMGKDDSLTKIVTELQMQTDLILDKNKENHISALIFTGSWIETIHSAAQVYLKGDKKTAAVLLEQISFTGKVIQVLTSQKERDEHIPDLVADLEQLNTDFNNLEEIKSIDLNEVDFSVIKVNDAALKLLCEKTESLREKIIK